MKKFYEVDYDNYSFWWKWERNVQEKVSAESKSINDVVKYIVDNMNSVAMVKADYGYQKEVHKFYEHCVVLMNYAEENEIDTYDSLLETADYIIRKYEHDRGELLYTVEVHIADVDD